MDTKYVIETDIGRDPDDFIALLWLIAQPDVEIDTVFITPGDLDQVAVADFIRRQCDVNFQICIPQGNRKERIGKKSSGGAHYKILKGHGAPLELEPDEYKPIQDRMGNSVIVSIGPMTNIYEYLSPINYQFDITIQGGFVPYSIYEPTEKLDKFIGKTYCPSFNFAGDRKAFDWAASYFKNATYVSKNICHTFEATLGDFNDNPKTRAGELLYEFARIYFDKHGSKKLHDLLPAMIATGKYDQSYLRTYGRPVRDGATFSWIKDDDYKYNFAVVDINYLDFYEGLLKV